MDFSTPEQAGGRSVRRAGGMLGFAMGGFFDGILLHQILQWHHLLSAIRTGILGDLRMQVAVDGLFHALMYVVAAVGLWILYRTRAHAPAVSLRPLWPAFWMGFGAWHIIDALFSHWITGIHRIRMDTDMPLFWDLAWLAAFGLLPFFVGWRGRSAGGGPPARRRHVSIGLLIAALAGAAAANLFPLRGDNDTTVVALLPNASATGLLQALDGTDARIVWTDRAGGVWVVQNLSLRESLALYGVGALYVSGTTSPAGCAAWLQPTQRASGGPTDGRT
ncbi:DUF2243 domain-containing protein [Achromobacter xylosoxidans]|uniref:DUF2243 domain-containing protein n=1 Tax=Alcaligenes xylosoxydans xylosoxydans TaxID=85698 RepID=UPI0022B8FD2E|nr:DUF2243 domain-containing protein [Achromobacter xylosoxidans]MCZ8392084.1 DUF2243 domain-containing protein [Achromobacter xylosoxidans]